MKYSGLHLTCNCATDQSSKMRMCILCGVRRFQITYLLHERDLIAYSCEPKRASVYSIDLRWRIIWQKEVFDLNSREIAANLGVDSTMVWRTVKLFRETGDVQKKRCH